MARKRTDLGDAAEAAIAQGAASGLSAAEVARRAGISERTASRRLAERRGSVVARGPAPSFAADLAVLAKADEPPPDAPPAPDSDGDLGLPTQADIEEASRGGPEAIDQMLASFLAQYQETPAGPLKKSWGALIKDTLREKRTGAPPAKVDPNAALDILEGAKRCRAMLHTLTETSPEEQGTE